ncbi:hypothetical protein [Methanospirillum lacunae]|uniref:hypothetical protein n=1 Tax=Methanospirillum lacunae TaxID=668570 RepID=UPI0015E86147|nr:hypothetical protein [Methanospirillum lacunae]
MGEYDFWAAGFYPVNGLGLSTLLPEKRYDIGADASIVRIITGYVQLLGFSCSR